MTAAEPAARARRERDYHNKAFAEGTRSPVAKYYSVTGAGRAYFNHEIESRAMHADALEYGCGPGSSAFRLAAAGARVSGIDISDVAIEKCRAHAHETDVDADFRVMDAEHLTVADASIDLVCGTGILHHLDLDAAFAQIARVARPGGTAVFIEPMGHNPIVNLYRKLTPKLRTPDEHPLRMRDFAAARRRFRRVDLRFFHLSTLAAVPFRRLPGFGGLVAALDAFDRVLFAALPFLRRYAWVVVITLTEPVAADSGATRATDS